MCNGNSYENTRFVKMCSGCSNKSMLLISMRRDCSYESTNLIKMRSSSSKESTRLVNMCSRSSNESRRRTKMRRNISFNYVRPDENLDNFVLMIVSIFVKRPLETKVIQSLQTPPKLGQHLQPVSSADVV